MLEKLTLNKENISCKKTRFIICIELDSLFPLFLACNYPEYVTSTMPQ